MRWTRRGLQRTAAVVVALLLVSGCGGDGGPDAAPTGPSTPMGSPSVSASAPGGYADQVNALCRDLLADVLAVDIGNAVTIEQFLGKHRPLVAAVRAFDARVDALVVADVDRAAADAFDDYRRFSDSADVLVVAAARTGDQAVFDAANAAFLEAIHAGPAEIEAMHAAGIRCNAR